jgi:transposase
MLRQMSFCTTSRRSDATRIALAELVQTGYPRALEGEKTRGSSNGNDGSAQQRRKADRLCREYGISRKTGEKFKKRFREQGPTGLEDQRRAPKLIPHKTPAELVAVLIAERRLHPTWGPKKLKDILERRLERPLPAPSTIGDILVEHGLVVPRRKRRRHTPRPTSRREAVAPNEVWCIDYKGQFRLGDGTHCYPLTVTDQFSRYIVGCEGMGAISDEAARDVCEELFRTFGVPEVMHSDNGVPFACTGLAGLTKLSAYWLRLGITLERSRLLATWR